MELNRIWHPYWEWDDFKAGMWRAVSGRERKQLLRKAYDFTSDHELYGSWMIKVVESWKKGCEHHLSNTSSNRRAWIGHAACCLATGCPEDITRQAWGYLTEDQKTKANHQADIAIAMWERKHAGKSSTLH